MVRIVLSVPQFSRWRGVVETISHPLRRLSDGALLLPQVEIVKSQIALRNGITMYVNTETPLIHSGEGNIGIRTAEARRKELVDGTSEIRRR